MTDIKVDLLRVIELVGGVMCCEPVAVADPGCVSLELGLRVGVDA